MSSVGIMTCYSLSRYSLKAASKIKNFKKHHQLEFMEKVYGRSII